MENFILDSFGATIKLTIFLCMIVIFIVKSMQFYMKQHEFWSMQVKLLYILFILEIANCYDVKDDVRLIAWLLLGLMLIFINLPPVL